MATRNNNGLLKHYTNVLFNGNAISAIPNFNFASDSGEPKESQRGTTMPPRTSMDLVPVIASSAYAHHPTLSSGNDHHGNAIPNAVLLSNARSHFTHDVCISDTSKNGHASPFEVVSEVRKDDDICGLPIRGVICRRRLESCARRLKRVQSRSAALLTRLIALNLPDVNSVRPCGISSTISRILAEDETESSTDDESCISQQPLSRLEEHWLCTRSVVSSHWHWLLTEIKKSEQSLKNLRVLKASYRKWKSELPLHPNSKEPSCSRVTPFLRDVSRQDSYHDLRSPGCGHLVNKANGATSDSLLRCSCIPHFIGPCILCCGAQKITTSPSSPDTQTVDLLTNAQSLASHIHPKLSLPGDIQLSLRLESRLAASPNVTFREHKATTHPVAPEDRPPCIRSYFASNPPVGRDVHHAHNTDFIHSESPLQHRESDIHSTRLKRFKPSADQNTLRPLRSITKSSNGPSALRRILDLTSDSDPSDASRVWQCSTKTDEK
ncbi:hypothetical protein EG68_02522 [Paragonimus skrjabini miyazakii]|uniref:PEHE domain-containing protein n=1 Tax=Paragonimus skrjabini miyazakii TaxID=59628 RepID=A0A8S9YWB5_9TREM|nr:hypothetical protein EG68_02522 [Paragonimus skrjabini miyazakii]